MSVCSNLTARKPLRFRASLIATGSILFCLPLLSWGQANVNEGQETASIYVDASKGSDSNNGSKTAPLKTIGASVALALSNNHSNVGSKVIINPGTYRESLTVGSSKKSTSQPITFQAATNGTVFISGADVISGWTVYGGNSKIYEATWPYRFGTCPAQGPPAPPQQEIVLREEMLIVSGKPLTQVLTLSSMQPGTFYVDEGHGLVYAYPPSGTNMSTAAVETAVRPSVLQLSGQSNIVFRGLTFEYANSCQQNAAVTLTGNATNVLFDSNALIWNNAMGVEVTKVENFTVENTVAEYNGQVGFGAHQVKNGLWQSDTANYNNWRGAQGAFYTWDAGGTKWMWDHNTTYKNMVSNFNQANGVAWDTDNENVTFTGGVSAFNIVNGMQIEKTEGPFTVSNSYFCYTNLLGVGQRGGIAVRNSEQVTLTNDVLYSSLINQFAVVGQPGGIPITNWETGQSYNLITKNFTASGNVINGAGASVISDSYLGNSDWTAFETTVKSNNNTFYSGSNTNAFVVPAPKSGTDISLASWQSETGQDKSSSWKSTSVPSACNVAAISKDFWIVSSSYDGATTNSSRQATLNLSTFGLGGITGNVALTLDGISEVKGLQGSLSSSSIGVTGSAVLTLTASSTTPKGTYPITVLGTVGNTTHTVTLSLVVK
ncbi:MAG TPA: hypothetical protein VI386_31450 [Candidatus Sulfotelmatobacter sp.]